MDFDKLKENLQAGDTSNGFRSSLESWKGIIKKEPEFLSPGQVDELLSCMSEWVIMRSSSKLVQEVLRLAIQLFYSLNLHSEFTFPLNETQKPTPSINLGFITCILSLMNSILKSEDPQRYKRILLSSLEISSQVVADKSILNSYRRKGTLKLILTYFKSLVKSNETSSRDLVRLICVMIAKLSYASAKNRDYITRKSGISILCSLIKLEGGLTDDLKVLNEAIGALGSMAGTKDQQLTVWVQGGIDAILELSQNSQLLRASSYALWRACIDNQEIQNVLYTSSFHRKAISLLGVELEVYTQTFLIGILRRIASNCK